MEEETGKVHLLVRYKDDGPYERTEIVRAYGSREDAEAAAYAEYRRNEDLRRANEAVLAHTYDTLWPRWREEYDACASTIDRLRKETERLRPEGSPWAWAYERLGENPEYVRSRDRQLEILETVRRSARDFSVERYPQLEEGRQRDGTFEPGWEHWVETVGLVGAR